MSEEMGCEHFMVWDGHTSKHGRGGQMSKPSMQDLREGSVSVMLTPIIGRFSMLKNDVAAKQENGALAMKVAGVTSPLRLKQVFAEVARREQVFAEARNTTPHIREHPRTSALQSVLDDLVNGRFG